MISNAFLYIILVYRCLFSQWDLVQGSIVYIQTDLGTAVDDLELSVYDVQNVVTGIKVKIVVKPRLQRPDHPFRVDGTNRGKAVIGLNYLDASELKVGAIPNLF